MAAAVPGTKAQEPELSGGDRLYSRKVVILTEKRKLNRHAERPSPEAAGKVKRFKGRSYSEQKVSSGTCPVHMTAIKGYIFWR